VADDRLSAALAEIREDIRLSLIGYGLDTDPEAAAASSYPPAVMTLRSAALLAAVEAVLKIADDAHEYDTFGSGDMHWDITPGEIREAVLAALTGREGTDAEAD
jgi:hypothetical protein